MDKEKFNRAIELNKKIEEFKSHKKALESSNIQYGGGLIFTYNSMHNDVPLKTEIFGEDFFKNYMAALDNKIETLKKEFDEL
jgi:diaminopimelate decarboxylase